MARTAAILAGWRRRPHVSGPRRNITWLPSGSASVYGGVDQLSGKEIRLRETVRARASRRETEREALRVQTRLLNQVDERRSPRTEATVNELLDRWDVTQLSDDPPERAWNGADVHGRLGVA